MNVKEIKPKSLLRKYKTIDSWFISRYALNIYRGCSHACVYCDGRAEKYNTDEDFDNEISVKINAAELLRKELGPDRKRKPLKKAFIIIGGGVSDAYQSAEQKYRITRSILEIIYEYGFPVHILTKSNLVLRDLDIIKKISDKSGAVVSFSLSTTNEKLAKTFEPFVSLPRERLKTMEKFTNAGIMCGTFLMPVIPFITDTPVEIDRALSDANHAGAKFVIFSGLTLKPGRQKQHFMNTVKTKFPEIAGKYNVIYKNENQWGNASTDYYISIHETLLALIKKHKMPLRVPVNAFSRLLEINDLVKVILEQVDYLLKLRGRKSPYSYAAYSVSKLDIPLTMLSDEEIKSLSGVGKVTHKFISEIIKTGKLDYLDYLMREVCRV